MLGNPLRGSLSNEVEHPLLVDCGHAAKLLGIGTRTLFRLTKSGEIPAVRIGTCVRYSPQTLATWVQSRLAPAQDQA